MASSQRKTTMAKLKRERGLALRCLEKQARKTARKPAAAGGAARAPEGSSPHDTSQPLANQPAVAAATQAFGDIARADAQKQRRG